MVAFGKNLGKIGIEWGITCPNGIVGFGKGKCFLALILDWVPFLSLFLPLLHFLFFFCFFLFFTPSQVHLIIGVYGFGWIVYLNSI